MHSKNLPDGPHPKALLVSLDSLLKSQLQCFFEAFGMPLEMVCCAGAVIDAAYSTAAPKVILLDCRLPAVAQGQMLAALHEAGIRRICALAMIANEVSDEWIARLREGAIDDIVPRDADSGAWRAHLSAMKRGHALFCELENLRETAHFALDLDRVTGAFNRETMLSILFRETDRVQRQRGALCVVMFDVDDFAHWKSELGAEVGDLLLREMAERTGRIMRSYDALGRMADERFMMVLPGCSLINAEMLAERMRLEVFGELFVMTDRNQERVPVRMTASFGLNSSRGRSPVVVVQEAEQVLEGGKLEGPNSIRTVSDTPPRLRSDEDALRLFPEVELLMG